MVDPLGRVRHLGPVGEIIGQPLPRGVHQRDVHHLVAPLRVRDAGAPRRPACPARCSWRARPGRPAGRCGGPPSRPAGLAADRAHSGAGRLGRAVPRDPRRARRRRSGAPHRSRPGRPGPGRRNRPGIRLPTGGRGTRRPRNRPARPRVPRRRRRGATRSMLGSAKGMWQKCTVRRSGRAVGQHLPEEGEVVVLHQDRRVRSGPGRPPCRPRPGCSCGSPPRPAASAGRTGAGGAGRRGGGGRYHRVVLATTS